MDLVGQLSQVFDLFGKVVGAAQALESAYDAAHEIDQHARKQFNEMFRIANRVNVKLHQVKLDNVAAGSTGKGLEVNISTGLEDLDNDLYQTYEQVAPCSNVPVSNLKVGARHSSVRSKTLL
jgi:hypothetical protein